MRQLFFALLLVPFSATFTAGCGKKENQVIEPSPQIDEAAESKQADKDQESVE